MIYDPTKFYIYFRTYHAGETDAVAEVTPLVFAQIEPWGEALATSMTQDVPEDVETLVWEDVSDKAESDMRPSELGKFAGKNVVEVAIC